MTHYIKSFIITLFLLIDGVMLVSAKEITTTLYSETGDKVTIHYEITHRDGDIFVTFTGLKKLLSGDHVRKYNDSDRVKVVFFDKNGGYYDTKFLSNMETEAIIINSDEVKYAWSKEGYVWLDEQPELHLKLLGPEATLSIPVYLVYYKRANTYNVFSYCGELEIPLTKSKGTGLYANTSTGTMPTTNIVPGHDDQNTELTDDEIALLLIDKIEILLASSSDMSLPEGLDTYTSQLRQLELKISSRDVKSQVVKVLRKAEEKKEEVARITSELKRQEEENTARKAVETNARQNLNYLSERLENIEDLTDDDVAEMKITANELRRQSHAIENAELAKQMRKTADRWDDEVKKREEQKKRRKIWMIIGGILLSALMVVGNQTLQHFRNLRNQKGIEDMQEKIVRRAESEAKRRAQSVVRNKVNRLENATRQKSREIVRNSVNKGVNNLTKKKGNNSYTI